MLLRGRGWLVVTCVSVCLGLSVSSLPTEAIAQAHSDADLKALLLRKIALFIQWPAGRRSEDDPLSVVTIGASALGESLARNAAGTRNLPAVRVSTASDLDGMSGAHVVFIASSQRARLQALLRYCEGRNVLTASDTEGFGRRGVAVNFYQEARRVRFEINVDALKRAGLRASYKLLSLARVVGDGK